MNLRSDLAIWQVWILSSASKCTGLVTDEMPQTVRDTTLIFAQCCLLITFDLVWWCLYLMLPLELSSPTNPDPNKPALSQTSQQEPKKWYHWSYSLQKSLCIPQKWGSQFCSGLYTMLIIASVFIVFPKHLADFLQVKGILYYSYMQITHFSM